MGKTEMDESDTYTNSQSSKSSAEQMYERHIETSVKDICCLNRDVKRQNENFKFQKEKDKWIDG